MLAIEKAIVPGPAPERPDPIVSHDAGVDAVQRQPALVVIATVRAPGYMHSRKSTGVTLYSHEADKGLGDLEARLPSGDFVRIHRRHIVNIRYIKELRKWGNRQYKIELTTPLPVELYVSRRCVEDVLQRLGGTA